MTDDGDITRQEIYDFIVQYKRDHDGLAPTLNEIAGGCHLSKAGVKYHMPYMELRGMIRIVGRRGIEIIGGSWFPPEDDADADTNPESDETRGDPDVTGEADHDAKASKAE